MSRMERLGRLGKGGKPKIDEKWLRASMEAVLATEDESERSTAVAKIIEKVARDEVFVSWAEVFTNTMLKNTEARSLTPTDVSQLAAESMLRRLLKFTDKDMRQIAHLSGKMFFIAKARIRQAEQSSEYTHLSGMTTLLRRHTKLAKVRSELILKLKREPTNAELVAAANADLTPEKIREGMQVSTEDLDTSIKVVAEWTDRTREDGTRISLLDSVVAAEPTTEEIAAAAVGRNHAHRVFVERIGGDDEHLLVFANAWAVAAAEDEKQPMVAAKESLVAMGVDDADVRRVSAKFSTRLRNFRAGYREALLEES